MAELGQDTFAEFIGATVERLESGRAQSQLTIGANHLNPHGTAHGAVLYSLSGVAIAAAINDEQTSGIVFSASIDYLAPSRDGDLLVAEAVVDEDAPNQWTVAVTITRPSDGVVVATATASAKLRPRNSAN